jgi:hypothetical protein
MIFEFSRLFYIGLALFLSNLFLFILPYVTNANEYNAFNKVYYFSSLIVVIGTFGFHYAYARIKIRYWIIILLSALNLMSASLVVYLFGINISGTVLIITGFLIAWFTVLFNVFSFEVLFSGLYKKYFFIFLTSSVILLLVLFLHFLTGLNMIFLYCFAVISIFGICFPLFNKGSLTGFSSIKNFYRAGAYAFIINSASGLAFASDKFFVNHFFPIQLAGAYTFSWILISPAFYIGNLFEKNIYAGTSGRLLNKTIRHSIYFIGTALVIYFSAILIIIYYLPSILPGAVSKESVKDIFPFMMSGYFVYILLHFPLNGLLFKAGEIITQRAVTILHLAIIIIFLVVFYLTKENFKYGNYTGLLGLIWAYLFSLLSSKILVLIRHKVIEGISH